VRAINMANIDFVFNNSVGSLNLFRWLHDGSYQRRSPFR